MATMLYKANGNKKIHNEYYHTIVIEDALIEKYLKEGWHESPQEASENKPITREELEQKAEELGLTFSKNISDLKLLGRIKDAMKEKKDK